MTTHETGAEAFSLGREMGGNERKDIQWDSVYVDERVSPFANSGHRDGDIVIELGDIVEGESAVEVIASIPKYR